MVAPLAGAWIEIDEKSCKKHRQKVAPLAGAWIEILTTVFRKMLIAVAPLAGAWIEICCSMSDGRHGTCRSPRGSVD